MSTDKIIAVNFDPCCECDETPSVPLAPPYSASGVIVTGAALPAIEAARDWLENRSLLDVDRESVSYLSASSSVEPEKADCGRNGVLNESWLLAVVSANLLCRMSLKQDVLERC